MAFAKNDTGSELVAELVTQHNQNLKAIADETTGNYHAAPSPLVAAADADDLATALVLVNELGLRIYNPDAHPNFPIGGHLGDTLRHKAASAGVLAAAFPATDLATAQTLANELKADFNVSLTEAGHHFNNDAVNTVAAADASDQATLETLLNEEKGDYNAHANNTVGLAYPTNGADVIELLTV